MKQQTSSLRRRSWALDKGKNTTSTTVFDALKARRTLKAAGIDEAQADAIVTTMAAAFDDTVATKSDLAVLKDELLSAFSNAINRMLIAQLAVAGLLFAALKLF